MAMIRRPRVAAIGLTDDQFASIEPLCGELRPATSLDDYLESYSFAETDVVVSTGILSSGFPISVNLMTIGSNLIYWSDAAYVNTKNENTERELSVTTVCPDLYKPLARELAKQLGQTAAPPVVMRTRKLDKTALVETTSGYPVALRLALPAKSSADDGETSSPIALLLPEASNLSAWFRAFLYDIHESDPVRVPQAPPRLSQPSDWYTPQERVLADRIAEIESKFERMSKERDRLQGELTAEGERAEQGARLALYADGGDLTAAVSELLTDLGFQVRDMDAEVEQWEPKREDLRLTLKGNPEWEAIVEVKGYTRGTRTNDGRQIREHRERYFAEEGRLPDLTVWLANPDRTSDPSSRVAPGRQVKEAADNVGAVHVLASDLYRQWVLVKTGKLDAQVVIESLVDAEPGLWTPQAASSNP